jgi:hypothetical protein
MEAKFIDKLEFTNGINKDIIKVLESNFLAARKEVAEFHKQFDDDSIEAIAKNVWDFQKQNITYKADGNKHQKIRRPARLIEDGEGDCKSYSLIAAAIMSYYTSVCFRYTSYREDPTPTHVYCVVKDEKGKVIIIDGVYNYFNSQKQFTNKIDHWMKISTLTEDINDNVIEADVNSIPLDNYTFNVIKHWTNTVNSLPKGSKQYIYAKNRLRYYLTEAGITTPGVNGIGKHGKGKAKVKGLFKKVVKKVKGVVHVVKAVNLAPARIDFLGLVRINYRGFATRLKKALETGKEPEIRKLWQDRLGGSMKSLNAAVDAGKNKKALFGSPKPKSVEGIGMAPAVIAAIVASAAPILIAISKLIPKGEAQGDDETVDPDTGKSLDPDSSDSITEGEKGIPLLKEIGGAIQKVGEIFSGGGSEHQSDFDGSETSDHGKGEDHGGGGAMKLLSNPIVLLGGGFLAYKLISKK